MCNDTAGIETELQKFAPFASKYLVWIVYYNEVY